ncbi:TRAP transporter, DctM subunit [Paracoccus isoporae]|uniref:TRAP transporter large permease protein n=1 Tax=Paracoccus isoporae TaxID=591205 RepID=A0A1G6ZL42_9RHOB|nr:TRAP transporter large permease [Paracoccus isoporae]SDE03142.1 TRAP transporter, DctM subunit [Paracoccus isoporae]
MTAFEIGLTGIGAFFLLLAMRVPIAIAMSIVGLIGGAAINGWATTLFVVGDLPFAATFPYGLSVVPLFVLMGTLALHTGLSRNLYDAGSAAFGSCRGGLSMGTIAACAGFGAICGSSLATAATMGQISIGEMRGRGYDSALSAATVAAGGTLGVLIPPSIILVIYAILAEQSIGRLFVAAIIPGLLATVLYMSAIWATARLKPALFPAAADRVPLVQRLQLALSAWPVVVVFGVVLGGLFAGLFSPTEAASVGVVGVTLIAALRGRLHRAAILRSARESASLTGMIFFILIGAALFNSFIETTQIAQALTDWVHDSAPSRVQVILGIVVLYIVLGCFMDSVSMIFLTMPFVFPVVLSYEIDAIWFGILLLSVVEIGLITPPVGMNLFVVKGAAPDLSMRDLYRAVTPFLLADCIRITLIILIPGLSLYLVHLMYGP